MFWRFGGYANISTIDTILEKQDFTVEDLLDEADLIQEVKQHNTKLIEYLRDDKVLEKLLDYVVAPKLEPVAAPEDDTKDEDEEGKGKARLLPFSRPRATSRADSSDEEEAEKKRNRYAGVAAEVLSSDTWSIYEALMENRPLIRRFWDFLKRPTPLDPLQASYFTKVNEALFDKKTEEMIELFKSIPDSTADLLRHVECPMIMDLLLKIIALDRTEGGQGIVEWLYSQDVIPTLLSFLGPEHNWVVQTAAGDFVKAIITISANASQNEQQCIGPNELTRQLVSKPCVEQLIKYMLGGGNPLTVGVGIVIEVIRKNNSDYDPDVGTESNTLPSSRDPIYLGTLLRLFAQAVPDFVHLIMNAPAQKQRISSTFGSKIEPLGFDRFKTCELMAELLHCSNMGLLNEVGSEELIAARDAERQRLRAEGKLHPQRVEEAPSSVEDLTMRMTASSPEEGRRLEVTNVSEDDGFEEVEHGGEQEDTAHEFVKAEEEISPKPASAEPVKEEDVFVDEPLSSPPLPQEKAQEKAQEKTEEKTREETQEKAEEKLDANGENHKQAAFEDPDLVVEPLSPSKARKTPEEHGTVAPKAEVTVADTDKPLPDLPRPMAKADEVLVADKSIHSEGESDSSVVYTPSVSEPESAPASTTEVFSREIKDDLSPHPEDTPAPLFSKRPAVSEQAAVADTPAPQETPAEVPAAPEPAAPEPPPRDEEPGTGSIIVAPLADRKEQAAEPVIPVVGDFLKMQFVEYRVVPTILSFFFSYPWNNFLHNVVYDIVQQVFNGPMDRGYNPTLTISLFEAADVTSAIINGQLASDEWQAKMKTRMGYMGHLTLIAEEVVKFTDRHPPELLSETVLEKVMSQDWINYVEGALAETRERDNAILGGIRPEVALGNRAGQNMSSNGLAAMGLSNIGSALGMSASTPSGGSNALAEAGLNGGLELNDGSGNGIGPFAISAGTMMSGFGSSSDEDDDDTEETDEDVNNEFRAYIDPLNNNNASSLNPPSIPPPPPPPPPLNIPPSRARLQLAARLAMHQKNNAAGASALSPASETKENGAGTEEDSSTRAAAPDPPPRNPFADDEEDEDIDSDDGEDEHDASGKSGAGEWGGSGKGSWWRKMVRPRGARSGRNRLGEADSDSDSDEDEDEEEDDEFGDFAMPELESAPGVGSDKPIIKPTPVHPPAHAVGGIGGMGTGKSALGSFWAFTSQGFSSSAGNSHETEMGKDAKETVDKGEGKGEKEREREEKVARAVEAKRRTSIEEPDEDEVVV